MSLTALYSEFKDYWTQELPQFPALANKLSCPLLLPDVENFDDMKQWSRQAVRILLVGKETKGWGPSKSYCRLEHFLSDPNGINELQNLYAKFNFGANYTPSPYWTAHKEIKEWQDTKFKEDSIVLSTNLFRFDYDEQSVLGNHQQAISYLNNDILAKEIKILNPSAVIFFTGPDYEWEIKGKFPSVNFVTQVDKNVPVKELSRFTSSSPQRKFFSAYHPKYLRLKEKWNFIEMILRQI